MNATRLKVLGGVALALACLVIWSIFANWGLVTLDVTGVPLSKVLRSIERQGHVKIASNLDPETPVKIRVEKAPVSEALDVLATRLDANWRLAYAAAPNKADLEKMVDRYSRNRDRGDRDRGGDQAQAGNRGQPNERSQENEIDVDTFYFPMGFNEFLSGDMAVPDPRKIEWVVSPVDDRTLHAYLSQFAQKTGAMAVVPEEWNPQVNSAPKKGRVPAAIRKLVKGAGGKVQELFLLTRSGRGGWGGGDLMAAAFGGGGWGGGNRGGSGRPALNGEWINERVGSMIDQLPADKKEQARQGYQEMRNFWESVQALPEEQRRAAVSEFLNSDSTQERMADRADRRDSRRTPEQRIERSQRYVERKKAMQESEGGGGL
jgi:hypothetical protein